ncbi:MAG: hypothetical protein HOV80_20460 [Polyangiaceae bacterium]|nr:hypothetical protein [Polyangiaceae bacterium]
MTLLSSEDWWEEPGDIGAPPFVYAVADEALSALLDWGSAAESSMPQLIRLIADGTPPVRVRAAKVACGLGDQGLAQIASLLDHDDPNLRRGMLAALGRGITPSVTEHAPYFLAVMRRLLDESTDVVFAADEVLRAKGNRWAPGTPHPPALAAALRTWLDEAPDAVPRLEARTTSSRTRFTAVRALGQLVGVEEAGNVLARLMTESPEAHEVQAAAESLASVGPVLSQETVDVLVNAFVERHSTCVGFIHVLAAYGERASLATAALERVLAEPPRDRSYATRVATEARRNAAAWALAAIAPGRKR